MLEFDPVKDYSNLKEWLKKHAANPRWNKEDLVEKEKQEEKTVGSTDNKM